MTMANPGAPIKNPRTDWEWKPLRGGEIERFCADCGERFEPTARVQKYCLACKPKHRGKAHYGGSAGYEDFKAGRSA